MSIVFNIILDFFISDWYCIAKGGLKMNSRIKEIRKENGLTQSEFADIIGLSQSGVSWIEQPGSNVDATVIKSICKTFHINEEWLKTGEGCKTENDVEDEYTRAVVEIDKGDPKARQAILDYWQLTDENKKLFWKFVDTFIKK